MTLELELVQERGQEEGGDVLCDPVAHAPTLAEREGLKVARFLELSIRLNVAENFRLAGTFTVKT